MVFQNHNHILKRSGFKFNLSKDSTMHRGYLVLGVVIGNVNSVPFGLPDDSDSDLVEIPSLKNITSIKIFHYH